MQTFAYFFEMSKPAQRACTTSAFDPFLATAPITWVFAAGRAGKFGSLTLGLTGTNPRFP